MHEVRPLQGERLGICVTGEDTANGRGVRAKENKRENGSTGHAGKRKSKLNMPKTQAGGDGPKEGRGSRSQERRETYHDQKKFDRERKDQRTTRRKCQAIGHHVDPPFSVRQSGAINTFRHRHRHTRCSAMIPVSHSQPVAAVKSGDSVGVIE